MGSRKELAEDVPWRGRSKGKPFPKISQKPLLTVRQTPNFNYAVSIMKHPDPIGKGLATEAFLESAGPECIVPGQVRPLKLLGLQEAKEGDTEMQILVAQMYYSGYGIPQDAQKKASKAQSRVTNLTAKQPGFNASESDSDEQK